MIANLIIIAYALEAKPGRQDAIDMLLAADEAQKEHDGPVVMRLVTQAVALLADIAKG